MNEGVMQHSDSIEQYKVRTRLLLENLEDSRHACDSKRRKWEGIVADLQKQLDLKGSELELSNLKNIELCIGAETLNAHLNVVESELNESKGRIVELLEKIKQD